MINIAVYDEKGQRVTCHVCGQPAVTFINISVNCASSVPSVMKPVCETHNPYKFSYKPAVRPESITGGK